MKQSEMNVSIEGLVSEINIREIDKNGKHFIAGDMVIEVDKGEKGVSMVPVNFISADTTKAGAPNKIYAGLMELNDYKSIAEVGRENATKVRIRHGRLTENMFVSPQDNNSVISTARIESNFFTKVNDIKPKAEFEMEACIIKMSDEKKMKDEEMEETGRMILTVGVVGYADRIDILNLIVDEPPKIEFIKQHWKEGDTVNIIGAIVYTSEIVSQKRKVGFGEAEDISYTRKTKELIVTAGSEFGLEGDLAYNSEDIGKALIARKERQEKLIEKAKEKSKPKATTGWEDEF